MITQPLNVGDYVRVTTRENKIVVGWALANLGLAGYATYTIRTREGDRDFNANFDKPEVLVPRGLTTQEAQEQIHRLRMALLAAGLPEHFIDSIQAGA